MQEEKSKKKAFSTFKLNDAYRQLSVKQVQPWNVEFRPVHPSPAFELHLERLKSFDTERSKEGKKLLIDAILLESVQAFQRLKIWKGGYIESDVAHGSVDYLVGETQDYVEAPLICIVEVKKHDAFEHGLAKCLMEMHACQYQNVKCDRKIDVFGIVTNSGTWQFYQYTAAGEVFGSPPFAVGQLETVLGPICHIFQQCEQNLSWFDPFFAVPFLSNGHHKVDEAETEVLYEVV
jgi:hypothetical protein